MFGLVYYMLKAMVSLLLLPFKIILELLEHSGRRRSHVRRGYVQAYGARVPERRAGGCASALPAILGIFFVFVFALLFFFWPLAIQRHWVTRQWVAPHWVSAWDSYNLTGHMTKGRWKVVSHSATSAAGLIVEAIWLPIAIMLAGLGARYALRSGNAARSVG